MEEQELGDPTAQEREGKKKWNHSNEQDVSLFREREYHSFLLWGIYEQKNELRDNNMSVVKVFQKIAETCADAKSNFGWFSFRNFVEQFSEFY